jgi:hypothetical protein
VDRSAGADSCLDADSSAGADSWVGADSCVGADSWEDDSGVAVGSGVVLALGDWAGGWIGFVAALELFVLAFFDPLALLALTVLPGNALAATSENTPVRATDPAISQRFALLSLRSAASLAFVCLGYMVNGGGGKPRPVTRPRSGGEAGLRARRRPPACPRSIWLALFSRPQVGCTPSALPFR